MDVEFSKFWDAWGRFVFGGLALLVVVGAAGTFAAERMPFSLTNLGVFLALGALSIFFWGVIIFVVIGVPLWLLAKLVKVIATYGKSGT